MSVGIDVPKKVFAHGWWTFDKEKISKSVGKVINVDELISITDNKDSIRYFLCRAVPFGDDGDFSEQAVIDRHNGELVNKLGNLVSRVTGLIEKNGIKKTKNSLKINFKKINKLMQNFELDKALNEIFAYIDLCNEYVQNKKPWETKDKKVLYELADAIKKISILLYSFIPLTAEKIAEKFGGWDFTLEEFEKPLGDVKVVKGENLFNRIEAPPIQTVSPNRPPLENKVKKEAPKGVPLIGKAGGKTNKAGKIEGIMTTGEVNFEDWAKMDIRVAEIKNVEEIEGADKLYKLILDVGELGERIICAGIKEYYSKKDLKGKKIIYFSNLKPRKMRGIESQGMLLAASTENHSSVILISPESEIANGIRVG